MAQERVRPMNVGPERRMNRPAQFEAKDILRFMLRHYRVVILFCVVAVIGAVAEHRLYPAFRSKSSLYIDLSDRMLQTVTSRLQGANFQDLNSLTTNDADKFIRYLQNYDFILTVVELVKSHGMTDQVVYNLLKNRSLLDSTKTKIFPKRTPTKENIRLFLGDGLQSWVTYSPLGFNGLSIQVTTPEIELSRKLADLFAEAALAWISKTELRQLDSAIEYIDGRITASENDIRKVEGELRDFKRKNRIFSIAGASASGSAKNNLEDELRLTMVQLAQNKRLVKNYEERLESQKQEIEDIIGDSRKSRLGNMTFKNQLAEKISEVEAENQVLSARIKSFQEQIAEAMASTNIGLEQEAYDFQKRFELQYNLYQELLREKFRVELTKISVQNRVRNLTKADYSEVARTVPLSRKLAFSLLVAIILSLAISATLDTLFPAVKSRQDLLELGFEYIGAIPEFGSRSKNANLFHRLNGKPQALLRFENDNLALGGILRIRAKLLNQMQKIGKDHGVIAFMGAGPNDGKTFTATNMAMAFASLGRKTLLVDTDLRARGSTRVFGLEGKAGLAEVIPDISQFGSIVTKSIFPHLDMLPVGRHIGSPSEIIAKGSLPELMKRLSEIYDFVILDTAPILLVPETSEIERSSDLMVFVASFNKTKVDDVLRSCDAMLEIGSGRVRYLAVLNRMDPRHDSLVLAPGAPYHYRYYGGERIS
jgi:capsular exopolysaccharide synthesis family protein